MSRYRRLFVPGGTYFFTLVTWHRRPLMASEERIELLRAAFRHIKSTRPFVIDGIVIMTWKVPSSNNCSRAMRAVDAARERLVATVVH